LTDVDRRYASSSVGGPRTGIEASLSSLIYQERDPYCVSTATLVEPRTISFGSLNSTKMRLAAGRNDTPPLAVAKIAKVGVALALIVIDALDAGAASHCPLVGSVWQRLIASGRLTDPVFAVAVIAALAPTLTVATAKAFEPWSR
jgi:hypothetical protein